MSLAELMSCVNYLPPLLWKIIGVRIWTLTYALKFYDFQTRDLTSLFCPTNSYHAVFFFHNYNILVFLPNPFFFFSGKQVTVHIKGKTECYECQPKPAPKSYPVCTITSTPSKVFTPISVVFVLFVICQVLRLSQLILDGMSSKCVLRKLWGLA